MIVTISLILLAAVTASLAVISVCGDTGSYTSPLMVTLWTLTAAAAAAVCLRRRLWRRPVVFAIHGALLLILAGALLTHLCGESTQVHLRAGREMPGPLKLTEFVVETCDGTQTPRDFTATVTDGISVTRVSMNTPGRLGSSTLTLSSYDSDLRGATLTVASDPWGKGVTYAGYILLGLSLAGYFLTPHTRWRQALRGLSAAALLLAAGVSDASAVNITPALREELGATPVFHNGRITSFEVMARDVAASVCAPGDPMEVVTGLLFDFGRWSSRDIIKVSDSGLRRQLGATGRRVSFDRFFEEVASGRLDIDDPATAARYSEDIARFRAVGALVSGQLLRFFPVASAEGSSVSWIAPTDKAATAATDDDRWIFIRKFFGLLNEQVVAGDTAGQAEMLDALRRYQLRETSGTMPSPLRLALERVYRRVAARVWPAAAAVAVGLALFIMRVAGRRPPRYISGAAAWLLLLYVAALTAIRWAVCGHVPLSNGYETMVFLALCLAAVSVIWPSLADAGILGAGLALCVASMSGAGASVAGLMPVLNSPLLSVHVVMVMASYALFFMMALTGVAGLLRSSDGPRMAELGRVMLYPALALLCGGIFVGAVWADVSWGRYWGWDPKETWALITMLVYSFAAHPSLIPPLGRPRPFNLFAAVAFATVLMTFFGVNYLLGGLHSYA